MSIPLTSGMNHLGLTVRDLTQTTAFFRDVLGWDVTAEDPNYPRTTVTDSSVDRKTGLGLHHLALEIADEATSLKLSETLSNTDDVVIEFMPEFMGAGPRKHMMFAEPGGLRIELLWAGV